MTPIGISAPADTRIARPATKPGAAARLGLSLGVGLAGGAVSWYFWTIPHTNPSDFAQLWAAARGFLQGVNPYEVVGPGRPFEWDFPLLYPLPAVVAAVPFALLPLHLADALFVGLGAAVLAWALTSRWLNNPQLAVFGSVAYLFALQLSQWSPLLMGAALLPGWGWLLACKPTSAVAVFCGYPNRRVLIGAAAFGVVTAVLWPWWIRDWLAAVQTAAHMTPPILHTGGFILLLAALRWRRPEGRVLLVLSCVPHTPVLYEVLPLFLIPRIIEEAALLAVLTYAVQFAVAAGAPYSDMAAQMARMGEWTVWLVYMPALVLVLRRPNVAPQDDLVAATVARARAVASGWWLAPSRSR